MIVEITWGNSFCHWETYCLLFIKWRQNSYLKFAMRITDNAFCMFKILQAQLAYIITHGIRANLEILSSGMPSDRAASEMNH